MATRPAPLRHSAAQAYEPHGGELWAPLNALYQKGKYAEAADRGRELAEANPQYAGLLYNVACCESLAGRKTEAVDHLRRAIEISERYRAYAKDDSDFDPGNQASGYSLAAVRGKLDCLSPVM